MTHSWRKSTRQRLRSTGNWLRRNGARACAGVPGLLIDLVGIAGAGCVSYGAWLVYRPAGFLVGGLLLMSAALLLGRRHGPAGT